MSPVTDDGWRPRASRSLRGLRAPRECRHRRPPPGTIVRGCFFGPGGNGAPGNFHFCWAVFCFRGGSRPSQASVSLGGESVTRLAAICGPGVAWPRTFVINPEPLFG